MESQSADAKSVLALYRRLIAMRQGEVALSIGAYTALSASGDLLSYKRQFENSRPLIIILNFGAAASHFSMTNGPLTGRVALSSHLDRAGEPVAERMALRAGEGLILELTR